MYRLRLLLIIVLASGSSSCWFQKAKPVRVFVPPPPPPRPAVVTQIPELPPPPDIEADDSSPSLSVLLSDGVSAAMPEAGPPPAAPRRPVAPPRTVATPPQPTPADPTPAPRIGQIFTADQLREYNRSIDESLDRVKRVLAMVAGRSLNAELTSIVTRIQTFQKQAEQARDADLVTAVNLARRADLLAQDLIKRLP
jgi:hypothetical protein